MVTMADPILDEIWHVREKLLKEHGGLEGYFRYVQKLDRARQQRTRRQKMKNVRKQLVKGAR